MVTGEILLYSVTIPPRLQYIADFAGSELFNRQIRLTKSIDEFRAFNGARINYSSNAITNAEFRIQPHSLLFEKEIRQQQIQCSGSGEQSRFFLSDDDLGFDIFAASFYLISRYEEYLAKTTDEYGRYDHRDSIAFREGFLHFPMVNLWFSLLKNKLKLKFPFISFYERTVSFIPTYDIDEAWSYRSKSAVRTLGGIGKALIKGEWSRVIERRNVLSGKEQDPYDAFDWIDQVNRQHRLEPIYFFLVPASTARYDRNILPSSQDLQQLIRTTGKKYRVGIHPSWQSGDKPSLLKSEIQTLESITGRHIECSRQHFIRFSLPGTYRLLIDSGITSDYSMGYGSINGFRASVTSSYFWYDLQKEQTTRLRLYPFCFMEANSYFELKQTPEEALKEMKSLYDTVRKVNGCFIPIWHNTFLGTEKNFKGWREVYEQFLMTTV